MQGRNAQPNADASPALDVALFTHFPPRKCPVSLPSLTHFSTRDGDDASSLASSSAAAGREWVHSSISCSGGRSLGGDAPRKVSPMGNLIPSRAVLLCGVLTMLACGVGLLVLAGCTAAQQASTEAAVPKVQEGASIVGYIAQPGTPTTQPANLTQAEQNIRTVVQQVGAVVPYGTQVLTGITLAAGAIGALAGGVGGAVAGTKSSALTWQGALSEVVTAATGFVDGDWSPATVVALAKAGLTSAAAAVPATPPITSTAAKPTT